MKQKNILFIFLVTLSAVFSCVRVDESQLEGNESAAEKVQMTFKAVIDGEGAQTKTVLGGDLGDDLRKVFWQPGDEIGVSKEKAEVYWDDYLSEVSKFTTDVTSRSESSIFTGSVEIGTRYKAFYPYNPETLRDSANIFIFNLPNEQKYVNGSFDPDAAPMVASANAGETFSFRNLCGILAIQLKGEGAVTSIVFNGNDADGNPWMVAGEYEVNPIAEGTPEIRYHGKGHKSVTLTCDEPVQLNPEIATPFYMVLPPATYSSFTVMVTTDDGTFMIQEGVKPLTVKRADIVAAGALTYVETLPIDLSEHGTANSYIVPGAGLYSFDVGTIGNGTYGLIPDAGFHTDDPTLNPASVDILWQDRQNVIESGSLTYDAVNKTVKFMATGHEGNAIVAARHENGNIIWSWHIWATDQPNEYVYVNNTGQYSVLDRNLGAIATYGATEDINGFVYQWGRKDPIRPDNYTPVANMSSIENAITNPTEVYFSAYYSSHWHENANSSLWTKDQKTIYDPCPVGYKVPHRDVWLSFSKTGAYHSNTGEINISGEYQFALGAYLFYDGINTTFYPVGTSIRNGEAWGNHGSWGEQWSTEASNNGQAYHFQLTYNSYYDNYLSLNETEWMNYCLHVRCMKDENHVDISYPNVDITEITDVTAESAVIHASIEAGDVSSVIERGIIWGTESGLTLENGTVVPETTGLNEYSVSLGGLNNATKYYVRAYATNERGTGYSDEASFYTAFSGEPVNLSSNGTANSYIVRPIYGEYYFDASVKGNSVESVGQIASVEVLWETRNTANSLKKGSVIASVELKGTDIHFMLPPDVKPGNALVAVKDALGTILWSWHIWVVDFDPIETQQTYLGGAVMMDRNLGALKVKGDVTSHGLIYYWGRKDPFPSLVSHSSFAATVPENVINSIDQHTSYEYAIQNPTTVITQGVWNDSDTNWSASKTIYDPCPVGWQVPSLNVWDKISYSGSTIPEPYSIPEAYYPPTGYLNGSEIIEFNYLSYVYSSSSSASNHAYIFRIPEFWTGSIDKDYGLAVRCMKSIAQTGSGNDYVVDDEYEWEE